MLLEGGPCDGCNWVINLGGKLLASLRMQEGIGFIFLELWGTVSQILCVYVWECYVGNISKRVSDPQFLTELSCWRQSVQSGWHLFGIWPGHLGLAVIIEHSSELQPLPFAWGGGWG